MLFSYFAPIIAADIVTRPAPPYCYDWNYTPIQDYSEAHKWAERTLTIHENAPEDEDCIQMLQKIRLPYEPVGFTKQYFGCHLFLRQNGRHSFFTHGIHSILDGRPNLVLLHRIFHIFAGSSAELSAAHPTKGTDVANLPPNVVHVLGEERFEEARRMGIELPKEVKDNKVCSIVAHHHPLIWDESSLA
jgi:hypothetical protein